MLVIKSPLFEEAEMVHLLMPLDDNDLKELTAISLHTPIFSEKEYRQAFVSRCNLE